MHPSMNTSGPTQGSAGIPECPGIEPPVQSSEPGAWSLGVSVGLLWRALAGPQDSRRLLSFRMDPAWNETLFLTSLYTAKRLNCPLMALDK